MTLTTLPGHYPAAIGWSTQGGRLTLYLILWRLDLFPGSGAVTNAWETWCRQGHLWRPA